MAIAINEMLIDVPPPEAVAGQQARDAQSAAAGPPTPLWTAAFAHLVEQQLAIAIERQARLAAD
jgi:hypothetical protein